MSDEDDSGIQAAETVLTVNAVILRYFRFAKTYYVKNDKPTDEINFMSTSRPVFIVAAELFLEESRDTSRTDLIGSCKLIYLDRFKI